MKKAGIRPVGISYDSVETLKTYADRNEIDFTLLSDEGSKTIDAFGIRNEQMNGIKMGAKNLEGVPHPGTYIINDEGVITAKLFVERYQDRHSLEQLYEAAKTAK